MPVGKPSVETCCLGEEWGECNRFLNLVPFLLLLVASCFSLFLFVAFFVCQSEPIEMITETNNRNNNQNKNQKKIDITISFCPVHGGLICMYCMYCMCFSYFSCNPQVQWHSVRPVAERTGAMRLRNRGRRENVEHGIGQHHCGPHEVEHGVERGR